MDEDDIRPLFTCKYCDRQFLKLSSLQVPTLKQTTFGTIRKFYFLSVTQGIIINQKIIEKQMGHVV